MRGDLTATLVGRNGKTSVRRAAPAKNPPIDCFYVYPTASTQKTPNADFNVDPGLIMAAELQAARFSRVCRVYAPVYRQLTIAGLMQTGITGSKPPPGAPPVNPVEPYQDVRSAWADYLAHYNRGRGFVLIGHSQGSFILIQLIQSEIDHDPVVRSRLVSAILPGGNVRIGTPPTTSPSSSTSTAGSFEHIPPCRSPAQTGCVIAYSSFTHVPPPGSIFGDANGPASGPSGGGRSTNDEVVCTNPGALGGGRATLETFFPTTENLLAGGTNQPRVTTPWVEYPNLLEGQCMTSGGASWLQVTDVRRPGDTRPHTTEVLGPSWGLHLLDINIALGNLVDVVQQQATTYRHRASGLKS